MVSKRCLRRRKIHIFGAFTPKLCRNAPNFFDVCVENTPKGPPQMSLIYNQLLKKFENYTIPHGGAESALWSFTLRPYRISNLFECHMKVLAI